MPKQYFNKKNALELIEGGDIDFLVENLGKFSSLDSEVAEKLIERGYKSYLAGNLKCFKNLDDNTSSTLIKIGYGKYVKENKDSFSNFGKQSYYSFEKCKEFEFIESNFEHFNFIDVKSLCEKSYPGFWVNDLHKIKAKNIDKETEYCLIKKLRDSGNTDCLLKNALKFKFYSPDDILQLLLDWGLDIIYGNIVGGIISNLDKFTNISEDIEMKLFKSVKDNRINELVENIGKFKHLPGLIIERVFNRGIYGYGVFNIGLEQDPLLTNFIKYVIKYDSKNNTNYEEELFNKLLAQNDDALLDNIDLFSFKPPIYKILSESLIKGRYWVIIKHIEHFPIEQKDLLDKVRKDLNGLSLRSLMKNINKFDGIDEEYITNKVIERLKTMDKNSSETTYILEKFFEGVEDSNNYKREEIFHKLYDIGLGDSLLYGFLYGYNITIDINFAHKLMLEKFKDTKGGDDNACLLNLDYYYYSFIPLIEEYGIVDGLDCDKELDYIDDYFNTYKNDSDYTYFYEDVVKCTDSMFCSNIFSSERLKTTYDNRIKLLNKNDYIRADDKFVYLGHPSYPFNLDAVDIYIILKKYNQTGIYDYFINETKQWPGKENTNISRLLDLLLSDGYYTSAAIIMNSKDYYELKHIKTFIETKEYEALKMLVYNSSCDERRNLLKLIKTCNTYLVDENGEDLNFEALEKLSVMKNDSDNSIIEQNRSNSNNFYDFDLPF